MLGRFLRLDLPRFSGVASEDAFEFLIVCKNRICNLGLFETRYLVTLFIS